MKYLLSASTSEEDNVEYYGELSIKEFLFLVDKLSHYVVIEPDEELIEERIQDKINETFSCEYRNYDLTEISNTLDDYSETIAQIEDFADEIKSICNNC